MKKFIMGRMTIRPEMRAEFIEFGRRHQEETRAEPGCLFFEIAVSLDSPDRLIVTECFVDEAAHQEHCNTPRMGWFNDNMARLVAEAQFHNVYSDTCKLDEVCFD